MIVYDTTDAAEAILREGFVDNTRDVAGDTFTGVFISDQPVSSDEGAKGDQLLQLELSDSIDLGQPIDLGRPLCWCVRAKQLNEHANATLLTAEQRDVAFAARRAAQEL